MLKTVINIDISSFSVDMPFVVVIFIPMTCFVLLVPFLLKKNLGKYHVSDTCQENSLLINTDFRSDLNIRQVLFFYI